MRDDDGQQRSIGWAKYAAVALIAILFVGVIGYFVGSRAVPQNNAYANSSAGVSVGLGGDNDAIPIYAGPPPGEQLDNQSDDQSRPPAPPSYVTQPSSASSDPMAGSVATGAAPADSGAAADAGLPTGDADRQGRQEIGDAIQSATQDALNRGSSVRWHKDGLSGFAIAGPAVSDDNRTCRNAYSTTVRDTGDTRTPNVRWCRSGDDGAWAAQ